MNPISTDLTPVLTDLYCKLKNLINDSFPSKYIYEDQLKSLQQDLSTQHFENSALLKENLDLKAQLETLINFSSEEKSQKESLISENLAFQNELCEMHSTIWDKEKALKDAIIDQEKKILDLTKNSMAQQGKIQELEKIIEELTRVKKDHEMTIKSYENQHSAYKKKFNELEKTLETNEEMSMILTKIQEIIESLSLHGSVFDIGTEQISPKRMREEQRVKTQTIDERFLEFLKTYGLENEFERLGDELYAYSNKKVSINVKNDCLVCRVGGGYMSIDEFLKGIQSKQQENEDKCLIPLSSPSKSPRNSAMRLSQDNVILKENLNTPSPKRLRIPGNAAGCKNVIMKAFTPVKKVGKILYK
ncbi:hypothetical protein SteCoe_22105 [Stentor coeruleus]|uniref:GAR domain-containing protein n=1 Tax=Stentor coeruleus TaxID=5963 RepID=A0A1R2BN42_9CILI|nr:hypothetical protein SteCoe_22105 [Stentor coeruleus]